MDEYLPDSVIPKDKLRFVSGDIIYNETNVKVGGEEKNLYQVTCLKSSSQTNIKINSIILIIINYRKKTANCQCWVQE